MFAWQATVQDDAGNAVPLPVVTVYQEDGVTLADIYAEDQVTPLANPFTGELEGFVQFWAEAGTYKIIGANGASETQVWNVFLDTPLTDAVAAADAAAASAAADAAVLSGFANRDPFSGVTTYGVYDYDLPYNPIDVDYIELNFGGFPKKPTDDFTLIAKGDSPSGWGIRFDADILDGEPITDGIDFWGHLVQPLAADPNAKFITPEQFSAIGDGSVNDTAAVIAAVALGLSAGRGVYFEKTYLTTATIPNLHNVYKFGPGAIKVGAAVIPIEPRQGDAITIYADPAGSAANDGLSSARAISTVTGAGAAIRSFDAYVQGTWTIQLAAGTYMEAVTFSGLFSKDNIITIQGPVAGHPNVPTATIAAPIITDKGMQLTLGHRFKLIDVLFSGFSNGQAINNNGGFLNLVNVHGANNAENMVALNHAFTAFTGGRFTGSGTGGGYKSYYNSVHDSGATSTEEATIFENFETGMQLGEGAQGHLDWIITQDNTTNVDFKRGCGACNTYKMTNQRGGTGVKAHNAPWYDNQIIWGTGADANTVNVDLRGSASEQKRQTLDYAMQAMRFNALQEIIPTVTLASTGVLQPLFAGPLIPDWAVSEGGGQIEFTACLRLALTGNMALRAYMAQGATVDQFANITVNAAATALYLTIRGSFDNEASFRGYIHAVDNAGTIYTANSDSTLSFKNVGGNFLIQISGTATNTITGWSCRYGDTVCG